MENLTPEEQKTLDALSKQIGTRGLVGGDVPIIGEIKPKKPVAMGKWVVCNPIYKKDKQTEGGIYIPKQGDPIENWQVESVGSDVENIKVGDIIIAPSIHQVGNVPTRQVWGIVPEDVIACVLKDE